MPMLANKFATRPLVLRLSTAAELMTANPLTFSRDTSVHKAAALLEFHNLEAAPVLDEGGRPAGLLTASACAAWKEYCVRLSPHGFVSEDLDRTTVDEIMSPVTEIVQEHDSSRDVIQRLLWQRPRRVFVVNDGGELVGVVSTADVLRHLLAGDTTRRALGAGASLLC